MLTPADDYPLHQTPETINISGKNAFNMPKIAALAIIKATNLCKS